MIKWFGFSKLIAGITAPLRSLGGGRGDSHRKREVVRARDPEALANYLVRDFAATLFVIPQAVQGLAPKQAATFLRQTRKILSDLGYEKRCRLLLLFADLIESPTVLNLEALCSFIDSSAQVDLKNSLDDEGQGDGYYALAVLGYFSQLTKKAARVSSKQARPVLKDFQGKQIEISSPEWMQIHQEWSEIRKLLRKLDTHSSSQARDDQRAKWQRQREEQLKELRYLSFLSPVVMELSDKLLAHNRRNH